MKNINLEIAWYYVVISLDLKKFSFACKDEGVEPGRSIRTYDLPDLEVNSVDLNETYLYINFIDGTQYQIKFESANEIVIDYFTVEGNLIDGIGAWDFYD
jgi:hypothetical protein